MSSTYFASVLTPASAAGNPWCALRTGSSVRARIRRIEALVNTGTGANVGLIRSATVGTASTSVLGQAYTTNDTTSTVNLDNAWAINPTISTNIYHRKMLVLATSSAGIIWDWDIDQPLIVPVSSSLLLWNYGAAGGVKMSVSIVWEE